MAYKEIETQMGPVWPDKNAPIKEGDTVEGTLKEIRPGEYGNNYIFEGATVNGEAVDGDLLVWGKTILHTKMASVEPGAKVKIEYAGDIKTGTGRMAQDFKVFVDN